MCWITCNQIYFWNGSAFKKRQITAKLSPLCFNPIGKITLFCFCFFAFFNLFLFRPTSLTQLFGTYTLCHVYVCIYACIYICTHIYIMLYVCDTYIVFLYTYIIVWGFLTGRYCILVEFTPFPLLLLLYFPRHPAPSPCAPFIIFFLKPAQCPLCVDSVCMGVAPSDGAWVASRGCLPEKHWGSFPRSHWLL